MKKVFVFLFTVVMFIIFAGCQPKQENTFVPGPGDMEPPHFATEQELTAHLKSLSGDEKTNCYYRLVNIPDAMEFDSYSSYFSYVDWWYFDPEFSTEARFIYLRWYFLGDGQEWLENDLKENGAGRTKLDAGGKTYYYLLVDEPGVDQPNLYDIEWVQDGFLFGMNILEKYLAPNGSLEEPLLLKYTELTKFSMDG